MLSIEHTFISDVALVKTAAAADDRGHFMRLFDASLFMQSGIASKWAQISEAFNYRRATLRGLHLQSKPHEEAKLVRCTRGAIFDVAVDRRVDSATYNRWFGTVLSGKNNTSLYVGKGIAHGYLTLTSNACVEYFIDEYYSPQHATGIRWNDPAIGISWPMQPLIMSKRDAQWDLLADT